MPQFGDNGAELHHRTDRKAVRPERSECLLPAPVKPGAGSNSSSNINNMLVAGRLKKHNLLYFITCISMGRSQEGNYTPIYFLKI